MEANYPLQNVGLCMLNFQERSKRVIQCIPRKVSKYHQSDSNEQIKRTLIGTIQHILDYLVIVYLQRKKRDIFVNIVFNCYYISIFFLPIYYLAFNLVHPY